MVDVIERLEIQCKSLSGDRAEGAYWERQFCFMAAKRHKTITPLQLVSPGKSASAHYLMADGKTWNILTLPDVTVWTAPGEHHEIKHKNPTPGQRYGLEEYRFDALVSFALETGQDVLYTIHDWELAGAADSKERVANRVEHWRTVRVLNLIGKYNTFNGTSWVNSKARDNVPIHYWPVSLWQPLESYWDQLALL